MTITVLHEKDQRLMSMVKTIMMFSFWYSTRRNVKVTVAVNMSVKVMIEPVSVHLNSLA